MSRYFRNLAVSLDQLANTILADDTDQIESIKAQYQTLVGGE